MDYSAPRNPRTLRHQGNRLLPTMSDCGSSSRPATRRDDESSSFASPDPIEPTPEPGQNYLRRVYTTDLAVGTLPYHASSTGHIWTPKNQFRPSTAPPQHSTNFSRRHPPHSPLREPSPYPKLRRKPSTIGLPLDTVTRSHTTPSSSTVLHSSTNTMPGQTVSESMLSPPASPLSLRHEPPSPVLSSRQPIHPALRESPRHDRHSSLTPFSSVPCNTPSTRYTASPAFSMASNQTSATSYSPNLVSTTWRVQQSPEMSGARRGPSLPSSPKAFRSPQESPSSPGVVSSEAAQAPALIPELAHLNMDSRPRLHIPSRPQRPAGDDIDDYANDCRSVPVIQSDIPASFAATFNATRPLSKDEDSEPPMSPTSSISKSIFTWGSRPGTSDSRKRKDSAISSLSPTSSRIESPLEPPSNLSTYPSQVSLASNTKTRGRLGRLFRRDKDEKPQPQAPNKTPRKGPVAGTGHEGYGKFGFRGRNFSLTSLTNRARSSSRDSKSSDASSHNGLNMWSKNTSQTDIRSFHQQDFASVARKRRSSIDTLELVRSGLISDKHLPPTFQPPSRTDRVPGSFDMKREQDNYHAEKSASPKRQNFLQRALARQKPKDSTKDGINGNERTGQWLNANLGYYASVSVGEGMGLAELNRLVELVRSHGSPNDVALPVASVPSMQENPPIAKRPESFRLDSSESPEVLHAVLAKPTVSPTTIDVVTENTFRTLRSSSLHAPAVKGNAFSSYTPNSHQDGSSNATTISSPTGSTEEFLSFPVRKDSQVSYTSDSGVLSVNSNSTVHAGEEGAPGWLGDEDIWNEYNDLIDEVMPVELPAVPAKDSPGPPSPSSSLGAPFYNDETYNSSRSESKLLPQIHALIRDIEEPEDDDESADRGVTDRFSQFLQPAATPSTPYSLSDIMAGYGDRTASYASTKARQSNLTEARQSTESGYSSLYSRMSGPSRPLSKPEYGDPISPVPEESESEKRTDVTSSPRKGRRSADADLRFGALMTSKWLSFGRVLFSPAHNEVKNGSDVRVLIVDGLGKDWSYYCALTYPNAVFYNLEVSLSEGKSSTRGQDLANYKNVRHTSVGAPFPFPRGFFTAVIFRFPVATTDNAYHSCIFECKRVLRPGGFLEISVLDLDMMNMGSIARRELRNLKMDMHSQNNAVSLRNLGDTMLTLVGKRGFENIQRCMVGIPVAGRIPKGEDTSSDSSGRSSVGAAMSAHDRGERITTKDFAGILYSQHSNSPTKARDNDEGITKMVAKVGRWWYSTCYGSVAEGDINIWDQPGLLRECERQGTAFRLLLCYAQKPTCPPRRTASV
ncbi:hypothetical protein K461DRAFT_318629 [Myriangium duriaei CBS 260.36]|uniref:Methyltransferase type 11 domain-containing protein n=1 Tax=Myriangium duriaei CBS 260.36 TaxID=1168546 RepID=A0A9P4JBJ9_9PEZI|nr:hypothetical protein K461DRAFT_318629 [Myriangium duriaei CBS 260.36]